MTTKIEWVARPGTTPETWNPMTGCTKVSPGCKHCYADRMAMRLNGRFGYPKAPNHFDVTLHPDRLEKPLRWRKPRTVFVCSMGDLFHEDVPDEFICSVFARIASAPKSLFIILTKRAKRMRRWFESVESGGEEAVNQYLDSLSYARSARREIGMDEPPPPTPQLRYIYNQCSHEALTECHWRKWPLSNLIGMVTVENQDQVWRVDELMKCPFAVRGVSCEPLLGSIDLTHQLRRMNYTPLRNGGNPYVERLGLDWVIAGGESGPGARPVHPENIRNIRNQCQETGVPFFFKAWGTWLPNAVEYGCYQPNADYNRRHVLVGGTHLPDVAMVRAGKKAAGRLLDGREWNEWPK